MSKRGNNEGSIYQAKDGRWRAAVSIGFKNGKPLRKAFSGSTRAEVGDKLTKFLRDRQLGLPVPDDRLTVGGFLTHWIDNTVKPSVRPKTHRSYTQMVANHLRKTLTAQEITKKGLDAVPGLAKVPLNKLSVQQLQQFYTAKLKAGNSPSLVRYLRTVLRIALNEAMRTGIIARNAAALSKPPRVPKSDSIGFSPDEAQRFLAAVHGHRFDALFTVALALGVETRRSACSFRR